MSAESSEEKSLAPSEKKLREARKKGQISKSSDVISAATMTILTLYVIFAWGSIMSAFGRMFDAAAKAATILGPEGWRIGLKETTDAMISIIVPLYILAVFSILIGSIISNRGILFSAHPITPDFSRLNPAQGFKKIFSLRNFVEFLKALIKSVLLFAGLALTSWFGFKTIMNVPLCGSPCYTEALLWVAAPVVFTALVLFLFSAVIDTGLQRWLFNREMRMTHSEHKRELKDMYGDPTVRRARNEYKRNMSDNGPEREDMESLEPTLIIAAGLQLAVGLRYIPGETTAPVVVSLSKGAAALELVDSARDAGVPIANDAYLAEQLFKQSRKLSFVPQPFFKDVARLLVRHRKR